MDLRVSSTQPGSDLVQTILDTGSYDVPLTQLTNAGAYRVSIARAHPATPTRTLTIVAMYTRP